MSMLTQIYDWFWDKKFWLPKHATEGWGALVSPSPDVYYPKLNDIGIQSMLLGFLFLAFRYVYERFLVVPIALKLGIKRKQRTVIEHNVVLETAYKERKIPSDDSIQVLRKKTNWTERQLQRWFRLRRNHDAPGKMKKFCECSWNFLFYLTSFWCGLLTLWDKPWLWDTKMNWLDHPTQHVPYEVYLFYLMELGYYWSLVYSTVYDNKRKDFWIMIIHHIATITLIVFSWICNYVRVGTLVLLAHDASDYWMALGKMASYAKKEAVTDFVFVIFIVIWILSRLVWYPFWIISSVLFESPVMHGGVFSAYLFFTVLLVTLQVLHIIWSYMIARIIAGRFSDDGKVKDVRSDTEPSDEEKSENGKVIHRGQDGAICPPSQDEVIPLSRVKQRA